MRIVRQFLSAAGSVFRFFWDLVAEIVAPFRRRKENDANPTSPRWTHLWSILRHAPVPFDRSPTATVAPRIRSSPLDPVEIPTTRLQAGVRRLRRAAIADLFDNLGLKFLPSSVWHYTDNAHDLGDGLRTFFTAVGVRTDKLREKRKAEVARANEILSLLVDIQGSFDRLSPSVVEAVADRLFSGDYNAVRSAARVAAWAGRIAISSESWPAASRLPLFDVFIERAQMALADPLSVPAETLAELDGEWQQVMRLLLAYDEAMAERRVLDAELSSETINAAAQTRAVWLAEFEEVETRLKQRDQTATDAAEDIAELQSILRRLTEGRHWDDSPPARSRQSPSQTPDAENSKGERTERRAALDLLGLSSSSALAKRQVLQAYGRFLKANHPDLGPQEPEEIERRRHLAGQAVRARDLLLAGL